jgi:hypothetical protein
MEPVNEGMKSWDNRSTWWCEVHRFVARTCFRIQGCGDVREADKSLSKVPIRIFFFGIRIYIYNARSYKDAHLIVVHEQSRMALVFRPSSRFQISQRAFVSEARRSKSSRVGDNKTDYFMTETEKETICSPSTFPPNIKPPLYHAS